MQRKLKENCVSNNDLLWLLFWLIVESRNADTLDLERPRNPWNADAI